MICRYLLLLNVGFSVVSASFLGRIWRTCCCIDSSAPVYVDGQRTREITINRASLLDHLEGLKGYRVPLLNFAHREALPTDEYLNPFLAHEHQHHSNDAQVAVDNEDFVTCLSLSMDTFQTIVLYLEQDPFSTHFPLEFTCTRLRTAMHYIRIQRLRKFNPFFKAPKLYRYRNDPFCIPQFFELEHIAMHCLPALKHRYPTWNAADIPVRECYGLILLHWLLNDPIRGISKERVEFLFKHHSLPKNFEAFAISSSGSCSNVESVQQALDRLVQFCLLYNISYALEILMSEFKGPELFEHVRFGAVRTSSLTQSSYFKRLLNRLENDELLSLAISAVTHKNDTLILECVQKILEPNRPRQMRDDFIHEILSSHHVPTGLAKLLNSNQEFCDFAIVMFDSCFEHHGYEMAMELLQYRDSKGYLIDSSKVVGDDDLLQHMRYFFIYCAELNSYTMEHNAAELNRLQAKLDGFQNFPFLLGKLNCPYFNVLTVIDNLRNRNTWPQFFSQLSHEPTLYENYHEFWGSIEKVYSLGDREGSSGFDPVNLNNVD